MLVPGFEVRELPIQLTSLNNVEYAPDGRLFAGGYDGRFHLLQDSDRDGLEDTVATFSGEVSTNYPLGLIVQDGDPLAVLANEVVRFRDTNADGIPDQRETVAQGFDDPELAKAEYLNHRRVDSALGLSCGPDGALYITMGNAGYNNPYWHDRAGARHYAPDRRRGCLLRISPDGKIEQIASGLRYVMSLQWNHEGDLFATDQEGATWVPNGNPADELLHLQSGRHYGFPPRHPVHLPAVIDEPSTWDYYPQHQSTCGFRFNGPSPGRGQFGPAFWAHDALVTGESRGKLWRTKLAKTQAGYVASTQLLATVGLLVVDCAVSPAGELVICCHTGRPDWGNGPQGPGRVFKIRLIDAKIPQPVLVWTASPTETVIAFDRPVTESAVTQLSERASVEAGKYVAAADRDEVDRPGYAVVQAQLRQPRWTLPIRQVRRAGEGHQVVIATDARAEAVNYALILNRGQMDLACDLTGLETTWHGTEAGRWQGWLPHPDLIAARRFTEGSQIHRELWDRLREPGRLTCTARLNLLNMLQPVTQPGSELDYEPPQETVTVAFKSDSTLHLEVDQGQVERVSELESRLTLSPKRGDSWPYLKLQLATPCRTIDVSWWTSADSRPRPLETRRLLMPFASPPAADLPARKIPELAGGDWRHGKELFFGRAACGTCHVIRGEGHSLGPDLSNQAHRDYESVRRDLLDPNATINPDAIGYQLLLNDGTTVSGIRFNQSPDELQLGQAGGKIMVIPLKDIAQITPMRTSLMPTGLEKLLTGSELQDLLTYLMTDEPRPAAKRPAASPKDKPASR